MTTIYSSAPYDDGCPQCATSLSKMTVWNTPPPIAGLVSDNIASAILNGGWTPRSVMELCALIFVASNGGIWVSPEVCVINSLDPLEPVIPFAGAVRMGVISPYIFGLEKGTPSAAAALKIVQDLVANEPGSLKIAEKESGIVTPVLEKMAAQKLLAVLPTELFAAFGVPRFAMEFVQSTDEKRSATLERMSGRFTDAPFLGVYTGRQGMISHLRFKVTDEIRVPPDTIGAPNQTDSQPAIQATTGNMVASFTGSMIDAGKNLLSGKRVKASPEEITRRNTICTGDKQTGAPKCEFFNEDAGRCSKCGCWTRFKIRLESEKCPEGKW